jgi:hypothetical protein
MLTVRLAAHAEARVRVDSEPPIEIEPNTARPIFIDPAPHTLRVEAQGHAPHEETIDSTRGVELARDVTLRENDTPTPDAIVPLWAPIATGVLAPAGIGIGAAGLALAASAASDAEQLRSDLGGSSGACRPGALLPSCGPAQGLLMGSSSPEAVHFR